MDLLERIKFTIAKSFPGLTFRSEGIVEGWELFAPGGGQWTTIDGKKYWTIWNYKTKDWGNGDYVRFKFFFGRDGTLIANDIFKVHEANRILVPA